MGAAFDGRYVYLVPHTQGIVARFDTTSSALGSDTAWSTYDVTRVVTTDAAPTDFMGAAFDGRFIYLIPFGSGFATVARYDIASPFTADCAWTTVDLTTIDAGGRPQSYGGAVFDGQYLYLIPFGTAQAARFQARADTMMPPLPAFHGSFL